MYNRHRQLTSGFEWGRIDLLLSLFVIFLTVAALSIIMVPKANENLNSGRMLVQLFWDNAIDADVDLWVRAPNDPAVGYSNRTGAVFDLLHDHRGFHIEGDFSNTEFAIARHLPEGQYNINASLFSSWDGKRPVKVWIKVQLLGNGPPVDIAKAEGFLKEEKDEITLLNFRIDADGHLVPGSINSTQKLLWRAG